MQFFGRAYELERQEPHMMRSARVDFRFEFQRCWSRPQKSGSSRSKRWHSSTTMTAGSSRVSSTAVRRTSKGVSPSVLAENPSARLRTPDQRAAIRRAEEPSGTKK